MWQPQGFYNEYILRTPVILAGEESAKGLFNYPASRIAVIHGSTFADRDVFLTAFSKREVRFIKRSWAGEPGMEGLSGSLKEIEEFSPDVIIAVGGGSVIDGSKLCRLFYEFPYYKAGETRLSGEFFKTKFIAVPTTIGSGAEVSSAAVFVDGDNHKKDMIVLHELQPDVVVYDVRYVMDTPPRLLIASAIDAMAHILEGYVSNQKNAIAELMAETGFSILCRELQKFIEKKSNELDFTKLQYAGYIGGIVQNHCIVGAAHAVAHQLTEYGYSHAEAVALLLPKVVGLNASDRNAAEKYNGILSKCGFTDIQSFNRFLENLNGISGISDRKKELSELIRKLAADGSFIDNVKSDKGGKGNPLAITDKYLKELIGSI